jgi:ADP-ribose pyrophosphatase YjhB (NUDIX family)
MVWPQEVQIDLSSISGRIKPAPVCLDESLRLDHMTAEELSEHCFPMVSPKKGSSTTTTTGPPPTSSGVVHIEHHNAITTSLPAGGRETRSTVVSSSCSSSSSASTGGSSVFSDFGDRSNKAFTTPVRLERQQSELINQKVMSQKQSRSGHDTQRWATEPSSGRVYRLVTGCVPIVEGGKILFVSASRKAEWILPKGGWETDEPMEESAIRESFEEAGVLGILGPRLGEIEYETRKAKKRRLDFQDVQQQQQKKAKSASAGISDEESGAARIRGPPSDETSSVVSAISDASLNTHSHVRMYMFPLYISQVKSSWPESGRFRKVVGIDEAIQMCETRPELQEALMEVKERKLHLPCQETI